MYLKVNIDYPRPLTILVLLGITVAMLWSQNVEAPVFADTRPQEEIFYHQGDISPQGGPDKRSYGIQESYVLHLRLEQNVLSKKTEILRDQLKMLERMGGVLGGQGLREARMRLVLLGKDEHRLEQEILASMRDLNGAQDRARSISTAPQRVPTGDMVFEWPVEPRYAISAGFHDQAYERRFGFAHQAVDIPIEQGSSVHAAFDGIVQEISDRGLGFNSITIAHQGGIATLYGHVSSFLVEEGMHVTKGDPIARSGGMPGTPGAGMLSTGPHVHFEVITSAGHVDPLVVLAKRFFGAAAL